MHLNYKQDLTGKHFHKRSYTDHKYHDYLVKPMLLFKTLNFSQQMFRIMEPRTYAVHPIL